MRANEHLLIANLVEQSRIEAALREARGSRVKAAKILKMSKGTLYRRMKEFGIGHGIGAVRTRRRTQGCGESEKILSMMTAGMPADATADYRARLARALYPALEPEAPSPMAPTVPPVLHSSPVSQRPQAGNGSTLIRCEFLDGRTLWRPLVNLEHGTLCRQFGVDPATYLFDLPTTAVTRGHSAPGRVVNGFIIHGRTREPIARITFAWESERFRDVDPTDRREALRLS